MTHPRAIVKLAAAALALCMIACTGPAAGATAAYQRIQGSGSSWAANAVNQWVADVHANGIQVDYTANGAAQGRKDFAAANSPVHFAVTDGPYRGQDPLTGAPDTPNGRALAYLPIVSGGTSFPYNIKVNGTQLTTLRLSGPTIADIFTMKITNWNDPEVTADNNGHALPSLPIIPVVRADGAGITNQFTTWLVKQYPQKWSACNGGKAAASDYFPLNCGASSGLMQARTGSEGVMNFVKSSNANGSIAMEEYSYPLFSGIPVARMLNAAGYYTLPTQYNVAVALTQAQINQDKSSPDYLTQTLDKVYVNPDPRTYPLSSYVYAVIPTAANDRKLKTTGQRQALTDFLYYGICQGQSGVGPIGYSPLPINLVQAGFEQIAKIKAADPKVVLTNRNVSTCNNPTFLAGKPDSNYLAQIAPNPPACAKQGADPCANNEDYVNANPKNGKAVKSDLPTPKNSSPTGSSNGPTSSGKVPSGAPTNAAQVPAAPGGGAQPAAGGTSDLGTSASTDQTAAAGQIVSTTLPADAQAGPPTALRGLVVALLFALLAVPVAVSRLLALNPRRPK